MSRNDRHSLARSLELALCFAQDALEYPDPDNISSACDFADQVLPRLGQLDRLQLTLSEAEHIALLVSRLRTVLAALEQVRPEGFVRARD